MLGIDVIVCARFTLISGVLAHGKPWGEDTGIRSRCSLLDVDEGVGGRDAVSATLDTVECVT